MAGLLWKVDLEFQPRCSWLLGCQILTRLPAFGKERSEHTKEEQLLVAQNKTLCHILVDMSSSKQWTVLLTVPQPPLRCFLLGLSCGPSARQILINHPVFLPSKQGNLRKGFLFLLCSEFEKRNGAHQYWSYEYNFVFSSAFDHDCSEAILTSTQPRFRP